MRRSFILLLSAVALGAQANPAVAPVSPAAASPYDEAADAQADIRHAVAEAARTKTQVLVVFGANWCGDCKMLDASFKSGTVAPLIQQRYQVVKVNVGRFKRERRHRRSLRRAAQEGHPSGGCVVSPRATAVRHHRRRTGRRTKDGRCRRA